MRKAIVSKQSKHIREPLKRTFFHVYMLILPIYTLTQTHTAQKASQTKRSREKAGKRETHSRGRDDGSKRTYLIKPSEGYFWYAAYSSVGGWGLEGHHWTARRRVCTIQRRGRHSHRLLPPFHFYCLSLFLPSPPPSTQPSILSLKQKRIFVKIRPEVLRSISQFLFEFAGEWDIIFTNPPPPSLRQLHERESRMETVCGCSSKPNFYTGWLNWNQTEGESTEVVLQGCLSYFLHSLPSDTWYTGLIMIVSGLRV